MYFFKKNVQFLLNQTSSDIHIFSMGIFMKNLLYVELMQCLQDLIENVRFKGVLKNLYVCLRLDLLQNKTQKG